MHLTPKLGVSLSVEFEDSIALSEHNLGNLFPVSTLVKKNIQGKVGYQGPGKCDALYRDVVKRGVCSVWLAKVGKRNLKAAVRLDNLTHRHSPLRPYRPNHAHSVFLVGVEIPTDASSIRGAPGPDNFHALHPTRSSVLSDRQS